MALQWQCIGNGSVLALLRRSHPSVCADICRLQYAVIGSHTPYCVCRRLYAFIGDPKVASAQPCFWGGFRGCLPAEFFGADTRWLPSCLPGKREGTKVVSAGKLLFLVSPFEFFCPLLTVLFPPFPPVRSGQPQSKRSTRKGSGQIPTRWRRQANSNRQTTARPAQAKLLRRFCLWSCTHAHRSTPALASRTLAGASSSGATPRTLSPNCG